MMRENNQGHGTVGNVIKGVEFGGTLEPAVTALILIPLSSGMAMKPKHVVVPDPGVQGVWVQDSGG